MCIHVCIHVCIMRVHECADVYACVSTCMFRAENERSVTFFIILYHILMKDLSLNLVLIVAANPSRQLVPESSCLCFLHWDYEWAAKQPTWLLLHLGISTFLSHTWMASISSAELCLQTHQLALLVNVLEFRINFWLCLGKYFQS